jgi:DNA (cytosine-5)-methyltransferase 1
MSHGGNDKMDPSMQTYVVQTIEGELHARRQSPLECERMQGFPDGWTDVDAAPDSQRFRELGNAVAVPVLEWTLRRLGAVDQQTRERAA